MNSKTRSPLKDKPLRQPGQSLDERREEIITDKLVFLVLLVTVSIYSAFRDWWIYFNPNASNPIFSTVIAALVLLWVAFKSWRLLPEARALRLARDGERAVGQFLELLRPRGYAVFHDIVGDGFNIDHLIVGPAGVFTIETKTISKPLKGSPKVVFDGNEVVVGGFKPDRDPIVQARSQAKWIGRLLKESTGLDYPVRPVVLFPGWFVESPKDSLREVWVLEPKALPAFLEREAIVLKEPDIRMGSYHLSRMIRVREKESEGK